MAYKFFINGKKLGKDDLKMPIALLLLIAFILLI